MQACSRHVVHMAQIKNPATIKHISCTCIMQPVYTAGQASTRFEVLLDKIRMPHKTWTEVFAKYDLEAWRATVRLLGHIRSGCG